MKGSILKLPKAKPGQHSLYGLIWGQASLLNALDQYAHVLCRNVLQETRQQCAAKSFLQLDLKLTMFKSLQMSIQMQMRSMRADSIEQRLDAPAFSGNRLYDYRHPQRLVVTC